MAPWRCTRPGLGRTQGTRRTGRPRFLPGAGNLGAGRRRPAACRRPGAPRVGDGGCWAGPTAPRACPGGAAADDPGRHPRRGLLDHQGPPRRILTLTAALVIPVQIVAALSSRDLGGGLFSSDVWVNDQTSTTGDTTTSSLNTLGLLAALILPSIALVCIAAAIAHLVMGWSVGHDASGREMINGRAQLVAAARHLRRSVHYGRDRRRLPLLPRRLRGHGPVRGGGAGHRGREGVDGRGVAAVDARSCAPASGPCWARPCSWASCRRRSATSCRSCPRASCWPSAWSRAGPSPPSGRSSARSSPPVRGRRPACCTSTCGCAPRASTSSWRRAGRSTVWP